MTSSQPIAARVAYHVCCAAEEVAGTEPELHTSVRPVRTSECYRGGAGLESGPYAFPRGDAQGGGVTPIPLAALFLLIMWGTEVCSAMENPPSAGESLHRLAEDRVRRFRMTYNYSLQEDQDFVGAFTSWSEAVKDGGSAVADAWMEVAADVDDAILLRAVDEAHMAATAARRGSAPPAIRHFQLSKPFYKARPKPTKAI